MAKRLNFLEHSKVVISERTDAEDMCLPKNPMVSYGTILYKDAAFEKGRYRIVVVRECKTLYGEKYNEAATILQDNASGHIYQFIVYAIDKREAFDNMVEMAFSFEITGAANDVVQYEDVEQESIAPTGNAMDDLDKMFKQEQTYETNYRESHSISFNEDGVPTETTESVNEEVHRSYDPEQQAHVTERNISTIRKEVTGAPTKFNFGGASGTKPRFSSMSMLNSMLSKEKNNVEQKNEPEGLPPILE